MTTPSLKLASVELAGLDATNPLGFLAALGSLVSSRAAGEFDARLRWTRSHTWVPVLHGLSTQDPSRMSDVIVANLRGKAVLPEAEQRRVEADKAYKSARTDVKKKVDEVKRQGLKGDDRSAAIEAHVRPLEMKRSRAREEWLRALRNAVPRPELALGARIDCTDEEYRELASILHDELEISTREPLDLLAAFGSDACRMEKSAAVEPTSFCFIKGGGHQDFLDTVRQLIAEANPERVRQTLFEPWQYRDPGLSMRWDPIEDRRYALTDVKPADEGVSTVWMANLLAYQGLSLFPCAPTREGLGTTGWMLLDEERVFTWPIWEFPLPLETIRSLLQIRELTEPHPERSSLRARGVVAVFRARRIKVGVGSNYKLNFSPARAV